MVTILGKKSIYQTILFHSSDVDPIDLMVNLKEFEKDINGMRKIFHPNLTIVETLSEKINSLFFSSSRDLIPSQVIKGSVCELYQKVLLLEK